MFYEFIFLVVNFTFREQFYDKKGNEMQRTIFDLVKYLPLSLKQYRIKIKSSKDIIQRMHITLILILFIIV